MQVQSEVKYDYKAILDALGLSNREKKIRASRLAQMILAEWSAEARGNLKGSILNTYLRSLSIQEASTTRIQVSLPKPGQSATLALMYELGMGPGGIGTTGPYDMRAFMLKPETRNIRRDKNGNLYLNVPFKHSAKQIEARGHKESVLKLARKLAPTFTANAPQVSPDGSNRSSKGGRLPRGLVAKMKYHHTTDIYAGMVRLASTYSKGKSGKPVVQTSGYMTWRRMTMNQRPPKWQHPGIAPLNLAARVYNKIPDMIRMIYNV